MAVPAGPKDIIKEQIDLKIESCGSTNQMVAPVEITFKIIGSDGRTVALTTPLH